MPWRVVDLSLRGQPRLYAQDRGGRELDVAFRPVADTADEDEGLHCESQGDGLPTMRRNLDPRD
jgi:hypothetical protein